MAKVTLADGTVIFDDAFPVLGAAWTGVTSANLFDTTAHTAEEYFKAALSAQLASQLAAGTAAFTLVSATMTGASQISMFDGMTVSGVNGLLSDLVFPTGIFLSSGYSSVPLYNSTTGYSKSTGLGGDSDVLNAVTTAFPGKATTTNDAASLQAEIFVTDPAATSLKFDLVFGSDEFPEFSNSYVDGAVVMVDGVNYALFNGASTPLSVTDANISGGYFYNNSGSTKSQGGANLPGAQMVLPVEYDGISQTLRVTARLGEGTGTTINGKSGTLHTIKIAIADTNDRSLDSGIWIGHMSLGQGSGLGVVVNFDESPAARDFFTNPAVLVSGSPDAQAFIVKYSQQTYDLLIANANGNQEINDAAGASSAISGYGGNDTLNGADGNDTLNGADGDDTLHGDAGNDLLNGGSGDDTAIFSGPFARYAITYNSATDRVIVTDSLAGGDGTDSVGRDVEHLSFADGVHDLADFLPSAAVATITAFGAVDFTTFGFSDVVPNAYRTDLYDNVNMTLNGAVYADVLAILWSKGGSLFQTYLTGDNLVYSGGGGFSGDSTGTLTAGTVTGYFLSTWNGTAYQPYLAIQGISIAAAAIWQDFLSSATTDDLAWLQSILQGANTVFASPGNDNLSGGAGTDTLSYAQAVSGVVVSLAVSGPQNTGGAGVDTLGGFESLAGSAFNDTLAGDGNANTLTGGAGNDTLEGGTGTDTLDGGAGTDTATYASAASAVTVSLAVAGAQATGGAGSDTLVGIENLTGSGFNDVLSGDGNANVLSGGAGNDTLNGGAGTDTLDGGAGTDTATYASAASAVTVSLAVAGARATGGAGSDTLVGIENLTGSGFNDVLSGDGNANVLGGGAGNDTLDGGAGTGSDTLDGGAGTDTATYASAASGVTVSLAVAGAQATGGAGSDTLVGIENLTGSGFNDVLSGDGNANVLGGGSGNDTLNGGAGTDTLDGGAGTDTATYASAASAVTVSLAVAGAQATGGAGSDTLVGIENLTGSSFNDVLSGDGNANVLGGGAGNDTLDGGAGNDTLDGGAGTDTATYGTAAAAVTVNLAVSGAQNTGGAGSDTLIAIENLTGSSFNDVLTSDANANVLSGGAGNDTLDGGAGNDTLDGGAGTDTAAYGSATAAVTVSLAVFGAQNTGGAGSDTLIAIENLTGSSFNDMLTGDANANVLRGGAGNDTLDGGAGNDALDGGAGTDTAAYGSVTAAVTVSLAISGAQNTGGSGSDTLVAIENLTGSSFNDTLTGDGNANVLSGGAGNDALDGAAGNDTLDGGAGTDMATYGTATAAVTVSLAVSAAQITGGAGSDTLIGIENLTGSGFNDVLTGDANANVLSGGAGNDMLDGGAGNDTLDGGAGTDTAAYGSAAAAVTVSLAVSSAQNTGGAGTDTLIGIESLTGSGFNDTLTGDGNANVLSGGAGNDALDGGAGNDTLDGGAGTDMATYGTATAAVTVSLAVSAAQITGGAGTDTLIGIENLTGSSFNDMLTGDANANVLSGGAGNDMLDGGAGNDTLDGGTGTDTATYGTATAVVTVNLAVSSAQNTGGAGTDTLIGIENLTGSSFNDVLTGDANANVLSGGAGNDTLDGGAGNDTLDGGTGTDTATYGTATAAVTVSLAVSGAQNTGGSGNDTLIAIENLTGSSFNDVLTGDANANVLSGGAGSDTLDGGAGNDTLDGGAGTDTAAYGTATAAVTVSLAVPGAQNTGGSGSDTLIAIENLTGSSFNDVLTGDANANVLSGGAGNDTLDGGAGNDTLDGGAGTDTAAYGYATAAVTVTLGVSGAQNTGGSGSDTLIGIENLTGSGFNDVLTGDANANVLRGGAGNDALSGGAGNDMLDGGAGTDAATYGTATAAVTVSLAASGAQNTGGSGSDTLIAIENLTGSSFNDTLTGDGNANALSGGAGSDTLDGGAGNDTLDGGAGTDTAAYGSATAAVTVNLAVSGAQNTGGAGTDTLISIENLTGSGFNDVLTGDANANVLSGGAGNDTLGGGAGNDTLDGGTGTDTAAYGSATAAVMVNLAVSSAQNTGGAGTDTLISIENLTGSGFNDVLTGDANANVLGGGAGNDTLDGGAGNDTLDGGAGTDTATYGTAAAAVTVSLAVPGAQNTGGSGTDTLVAIENLTGSSFNDALTGDGNANALSGGAGNDALDGGAGNDTLYGGAGTDTATYGTATVAVTVSLAVSGIQNTGGSGSDTLISIENLTGSSFNDTLTGDGNANALSGGAGSDTLDGGAGNDTLDGGAGTDTAAYGSATAAVTVNLAVSGVQNTGGAGSDTLIAIENLTGSSFNDTLTGDGNANVLSGGAGNDTLGGGAGNDTLDGGAGTDTAAYGSATSAVTVSLAVSGAQNTGGAGSDTLISIENLTGSSFNDVLTGDGNANTLSGGAGSDTLNGGGGNDTLDGGAGTDTATYGTATAAVTVSLAISGAQSTGGSGTDTLISIENLTGSGFNDTLTGDGNANVLSGGAGNDKMEGGAGNDTLDGGAGTDTAAYGTATAAVTVSLAGSGAQNTGGAGTDTLVNIENLEGSAFGDTLTGNAGVNTLIGNDGDDYLIGGAGADVLDGGNGNDFASYINASAAVVASLANPSVNTGDAAGDTYVSIERLAGSAFNDTLTGDSGNNSLRGGLGADKLDGGAGTDTASYTTAATAVTVSLANPSLNTGEAAGDTFISIENLSGSAFNDTLIGDSGNNTLLGNGGGDVLNGGAGTDTASYTNATSGVTALLANPSVNTGEAAGDSYISIENLTGTNFNDTLIGDSNQNFLVGGAGADVLNGGAGLDYAGYTNATSGVTASLANPSINTGDAAGDSYISIERLAGSAFNDTLIGNSGDNSLRGNAGADVLDGGAGFDYASYFTASSGVTASLANPIVNTGEAAGDQYISIEGLSGSAFNDILIGDANDNFLSGQGGGDVLNGGTGNDYANYGDATSGVVASLANPSVNTGEAAGDTYISIESLAGSAFNDVLVGDNNNNVLRGQAGADTLIGGGGFDSASYVNAGAGVTASLANPSLNTGDAAGDTYSSIETLHGSNFADNLTGDANNNSLRGNDGGDRLDGGGGFDYANYDFAATGVTASLANPSGNTGYAVGDTYISIEGLFGSAFNDSLTGDANSNGLQGGAGADRLDGGGGSDVAFYYDSPIGLTVSLANPGLNTGIAAGDTFFNVEGLGGTAFADTLYGDGGSNTLRGFDGNDILAGGAGADFLQGDEFGQPTNGIDTASYATATAGVVASLVNPSVNTRDAAGDSYYSIESLTGSNFNDALTGDANNNVLDGGLGNDTLDGGGGVDTAMYASATGSVFVNLALSGAQNTGAAGTDTLTNIENLTGSSFGDRLFGNAGINCLSGGAGDDTLVGGAGADVLDGGDGSDTASYAGASSAVTASLVNATANTGDAAGDTYISVENLAGTNLNDKLTGDAGNNALYGLGGADHLDGGDGFDVAAYFGAATAVTASLANPGPNTGDAAGDTYVSIEGLSGTAFNDTLIGDGGNNILIGNAGADSLNGGAGIDIAGYFFATSGLTVSLANPSANTREAVGDTYTSIEGLAGSAFNDTLTGDGGNNVLEGGLGTNVLDGGNGSDTASYLHAAGAVTVSLAVAGAQNTGEAGTDTLVSIENLAGSAFGDMLTGNAGVNTLSGNDGDDTLIGGAGADILDGGNGTDYASYINASTAVVASLANSSLNSGDAAGDTYTSIEGLAGSAFNDTLTGNSGNNSLRGGLGADKLDGSAGRDTASYFAAATAVTVSLANPSLNTGEAAGDTFISIENISGSAFNDTLIGDDGNNGLLGQGGADLLYGGRGFDTASYQNASSGLTVSLGNPSVNTGEAAGDLYFSIENLEGTDFNDTLTGDAGGNTLIGRAGADVLDGQGGFDYASYSSASTAVTASLIDPSANTGDAAGDTYRSIEGLTGSQFNDTLIGDGGGNWLEGLGGTDKLDGGAGFDVASYYQSAVGVTASLANPTSNTGDAAGDVYTSIEGLGGSLFNDVLVGDDGDNTLAGQVGADSLNGGAGFDTAAYYNATSGVTASLINAAANTGEAAGDTYTSIEGLIGSDFNDRLTGDGGDNTLRGGAGADVLDGGAGFDYASYSTAGAAVTAMLATPAGNTGEAAGDSYAGIEGMIGSGFGDVLGGGSGNNTLIGNQGGDTFVGGAGDDKFYGNTLTSKFDGVVDRADYRNQAGLTQGIVVNWAAGTVKGQAGIVGTDQLFGVEGVYGTQFGDIFDATGYTTASQAAGDFASGNLAYQNIRPGAGNDTITGNGNTELSYGDATSGLTVTLTSPGTGTVTGGGLGTDTLKGGVSRFVGSSYDDTFNGSTASDIFDGGLGGDDLFRGGLDNDLVEYDGRPDPIVVRLAAGTVIGRYPVSIIGSDTLVSIEQIRGSEGDDIYDATGFSGTSTNAGSSGTYNRFDGQGGANSIIGNGNTQIAYYSATSGITTTATGIGSGTVAATYSANTATDTFTNVLWIAGSNFNDSMFGGDGKERFEGRSGNDSLSGNNGDDTLGGGAGADQLFGGAGLDTASYADSGAGLTASLGNSSFNTGDAAGDTYNSIENLSGSNFNDVLSGDSGNNRLDGGNGDDVLQGGIGADTLVGGAGVDFASYASSLSGITASLVAPGSNTGEAAGDTYTSTEGLIGTAFADILIGDGNSSFLVGGAAGDTLNGGDGLDFASYRTSAIGITASLANPAANTGDAAGDSYFSIEGLAGSQLADQLYGDSGANVLVGEGGGDFLNGGAGNDTASYRTAVAGVTADLTANQGFSGDAAGDSFSSIENLDGSNFADKLYGNSGVNVLTGNDGDDLLSGEGGADVLTGGLGKDTFLFERPLVAGAVTTIIDLTAGTDTIALSQAIFTHAGAVGPLAAGAFFTGTAAHDAGDRIIYNSSTGSLMYDADGNGSGAATIFATAATGLSLSASDFKVV